MTDPKTVPGGTPVFTISKSKNMPLSLTLCLWLAGNENSNSFASWEKLLFSIF